VPDLVNGNVVGIPVRDIVTVIDFVNGNVVGILDLVIDIVGVVVGNNDAGIVIGPDGDIVTVIDFVAGYDDAAPVLDIVLVGETDTVKDVVTDFVANNDAGTVIGPDGDIVTVGVVVASNDAGTVIGPDRDIVTVIDFVAGYDDATPELDLVIVGLTECVRDDVIDLVFGSVVGIFDRDFVYVGVIEYVIDDVPDIVFLNVVGTEDLVIDIVKLRDFVNVTDTVPVELIVRVLYGVVGYGVGVNVTDLETVTLIVLVAYNVVGNPENVKDTVGVTVIVLACDVGKTVGLKDIVGLFEFIIDVVTINVDKTVGVMVILLDDV